MAAIVGAMLLILWRQGSSKPPGPTTDPIARAKEMETDLGLVRSLRFKAPITAQLQTPADFRAYMDRTAEKQATKLEAATVALVELGLLKTTTNLGRAVAETMVTQAAAYYDPATKKFSIVQLPEPGQNRDILLSHELTHGLQDQHFDLTRFIEAPGLTSDEIIARRFVVEGDAMWTSILFAVFVSTGKYTVEREQIRAMRPHLAKLATDDLATMIAALQQQTVGNSDPTIKASIAAMGSLPPIVLFPLLASYMHGSLFVLDVYEKDGAIAVDKLFADPPQSTEQVLHIDRWRSRERPARVTLPELEDAELVLSDVIGELQWRVYFDLWPHDGDGHPEENWGGDRFAVWRAPDGALTTLLATTWDTPAAAKVFHDAYVSTLDARFETSERPLVALRDQDVFVIRGGTQALLDGLVEQTEIER